MENKIAFKYAFENSEIQQCVDSLGWMKAKRYVPLTVASALVKTIYHFAVGVFAFLRDLIFFVGVSSAFRWTIFTCTRDLGEAWGCLTLWVPLYKDEESYEKIAFNVLHKKQYTEAYREAVSHKIYKQVVADIEQGQTTVKDFLEACELYLSQVEEGVKELNNIDEKIIEGINKECNKLKQEFEKLIKHRDTYNEITNLMKSEVIPSIFSKTISSKASLRRFNISLNGFSICAHDFKISHIYFSNGCEKVLANTPKFKEIKPETVKIFSSYKGKEVQKFLKNFHLQ